MLTKRSHQLGLDSIATCCPSSPRSWSSQSLAELGLFCRLATEFPNLQGDSPTSDTSVASAEEYAGNIVLQTNALLFNFIKQQGTQTCL